MTLDSPFSSEAEIGLRARPRLKPVRQGFTLVEVTLAIMIVAVGMVSVFALFPTGLQMNGDASDNTRVGMVANMLLSAVAARLHKDNPNRTSLGNIPFPLPNDRWFDSGGSPLSLVIDATGSEQTVELYGKQDGGGTAYLKHHFRYRITVTSPANPPTRIKVEVSPNSLRDVTKYPQYVFYRDIANENTTP